MSQRKIMTLMSFLAFSVSYAMRSCLSVAITEMVIPSNDTENGNQSLICPAADNTSPTNKNNHSMVFLNFGLNNNHLYLYYYISFYRHFICKDATKFDWNQQQQGWILSSFFIDYVSTHGYVGGSLAERFGGKWILLLGVLIINIVTAITPIALEYGLF